jgi:hypothetical protein
MSNLPLFDFSAQLFQMAFADTSRRKKDVMLQGEDQKRCSAAIKN